MRLALLALLCLPLVAQDRLYRVSVVTVAAAHVVDAHSSWGGYEANPLLGSGRFGGRHAAIKAAWVAGPLVAQSRMPAKHRRWMTWVNFATAGALMWVAGRNYRVK